MRKKNKQAKDFSPEVIKRMALYLRGLKSLRGINVKIISSLDITTILDVSASGSNSIFSIGKSLQIL